MVDPRVSVFLVMDYAYYLVFVFISFLFLVFFSAV